VKLLFPTSLLLSAVTMLSLAAAESPGGADQPLYRFLFVVDTSASMARQKEVAADAMGKLIAAGINGRIQTGDLLGVWTIGDKLNRAAYGPKMWSDASRPEIAGQVFNLVRDARSSKPANLGMAVAAVREAAQASGSLTVFLVTDGTALIQGTPFDDAINEVFRGHSAAMKKSKSPFVVVLTAQQGELVSQAISPGGARIYIPPAPRTSTNAALEPALFGIKVVETNAVDPGAVKTNTPKTLSVSEISEILLKQQAARTNVARPVADSAGGTNAADIVAGNEAKPGTTESASTPVAAVTPEASTEASVSRPLSRPAEVVNPPETKTEAAVPSGDVAAAVESGRPAAPDAVAEPTLTPPAAQEPVVVLTVTASDLSRRYLAMAGGLFLVALFLGWLLIRWRRPRSHPSLITRSLRERERH